MSELSEQLRNWAGQLRFGDPPGGGALRTSLYEAADRIEALEADHAHTTKLLDDIMRALAVERALADQLAEALTEAADMLGWVQEDAALAAYRAARSELEQ